MFVQLLDLSRRDIALEHDVHLVTMLLRLFWDGGERRSRDIVVRRLWMRGSFVVDTWRHDRPLLNDSFCWHKSQWVDTVVARRQHDSRFARVRALLRDKTWVLWNVSVEHKYPTARKTVGDVMDSWTLLDSLLTTTRLTDLQVGGEKKRGIDDKLWYPVETTRNWHWSNDKKNKKTIIQNQTNTKIQIFEFLTRTNLTYQIDRNILKSFLNIDGYFPRTSSADFHDRNVFDRRILFFTI